ncbi:MAG: helix-turn-helix domain-containing protein [Spongiibacteraceae bacterium]|jgi:AraC family transcriptional activator of pobA|nr:helix-turn-helix domain-containing protein [Spongiibacteraceae bacterium]
MATPPSRNSRVPVFSLYGETDAWPTPDYLHWEAIRDRSLRHSWVIKPHRHGDLTQLLYLQDGEAEVFIEGLTRKVRGHTLTVVPALSVHGFNFPEGTRGHVLSLALPLTEQLQQQLSTNALQEFLCLPVTGTDVTEVDHLFAEIAREYRNLDSGRDVALHALTTLLTLWISRRAAREQAVPASEAGRSQLLAFQQLIEKHFREQRSLEWYAAALQISSGHLNALCRRLTGHSALQLIHQRLVLEAKRNLVYTALTIQEISDLLGFSEPAYFSRFFKREVGQSPSRFRQNSSSGLPTSESTTQPPVVSPDVM